MIRVQIRWLIPRPMGKVSQKFQSPITEWFVNIEIEYMSWCTRAAMNLMKLNILLSLPKVKTLTYFHTYHL